MVVVDLLELARRRLQLGEAEVALANLGELLSRDLP